MGVGRSEQNFIRWIGRWVLGTGITMACCAAQADSGLLPQAQAAIAPASNALSSAIPNASSASVSTAAGPTVMVPAAVVEDAYQSAMAEIQEELRKPILGQFDCAEKMQVTVAPDPRIADRFHVTLGKHRYHMHPVGTDTGVIRLEDSAEGLVWLQLGNKSMLMNAKQGRRMADECTSAPQRRLVQLMKERPQAELFK